jgi:hypothetical protein
MNIHERGLKSKPAEVRLDFLQPSCPARIADFCVLRSVMRHEKYFRE